MQHEMDFGTRLRAGSTHHGRDSGAARTCDWPLRRFGRQLCSRGTPLIVACFCVVLLAGCDLPLPAFSDKTVGQALDDYDGDSWPACQPGEEPSDAAPCDCNDANDGIHPHAAEQCNQRDDDCDGRQDDGLIFEDYFADEDGDGYGSASSSYNGCQRLEGYVRDGSDCNDADGAIHPSSPESCDSLDNNCDGAADEGWPTSVWYQDRDDDGYGDPAHPREQCNQPEGYVADNGDCNDEDPRYHPGSTAETCDDPEKVDYNCDSSTGYADRDGDGVAACNDCYDNDEHAYPDAWEQCDGIDNNCNGTVDDDAAEQTWYRDVDEDGFGDVDAATTLTGCDNPGYVLEAGDCVDDDRAVHPGALEACDNVDNDCDMQIDEDLEQTAWYLDTDEDGYGWNPEYEEIHEYGEAGTVVACARPVGYVADHSDCNDRDEAFHPGAPEACSSTDLNDYNCDGSVGYVDGDGDGFYACDDDCDDAHAAAYPGGLEVCDGLDNDCNGQVDDAGEQNWYRDADGDGYGVQNADSPGTSLYGCGHSGLTTKLGDCDDAEAAVNPGALEVCDGHDTDCDADVPEGEADQDGDGVRGCIEDGQLADCDDTDPARAPTLLEVCDDIDNDCDAQVDEEADLVWYADFDQDGYGDPAVAQVACDRPAGYVDNTGDCRDDRADIHPGALEVCDAYDQDEDCDGQVDDSDPDVAVETLSVWYLDRDGDGYGAGEAYSSCDAPGDEAGYSARGDDCDDQNPQAWPGAPEQCGDGIDANCDGADDNDQTDGDGDGFARCEDCDDTDPGSSPAMPEVCDAADRDEDCDGLSDDADPGTSGADTRWYPDQDRDGYGDDGAAGELRCDAPEDGAWVTTADDCNDGDSAVHPGMLERCYTPYDDDCDGTVNETGSVDAVVWYQDLDLDGHGTATSTLSACTLPAGYAGTSDDCDDAAASVYPGAAEVCDPADRDENCNGVADDQDTLVKSNSYLAWYPDADGDLYGSGDTPALRCERPEGYTELAGDCDDGDPAINPGAAELCGDGVDNNCNDQQDEGAKGTYYPDADGDGYGLESSGLEACERPDGYVALPGDCDDGQASSYPGALELCDGLDNDCDGAVDDGLETRPYYPDQDGDGYGPTYLGEARCGPAEGEVAAGGDCNDADASSYPDAPELCDDRDNDCDGTVDNDVVKFIYYKDADGDGYGSDTTTKTECALPPGYVAQAGDCNDYDATINPAATEDCDGRDDNCNGVLDEGLEQQTWYRDADGDGYGDPDDTTSACAEPTGYAGNALDCNDLEDDISPEAEEHCFDGEDNNCDQAIDLEDTQCEDLGEVCEVGSEGQPYTAIQDAIDAVYFREAGCGTIVVYPGTYTENLDFSGLNITVQSTDGPEATIIDGLDLGSVVLFNQGETDARLSGFTLSNGNGTPGCSAGRCGGGILIDNGASPRLDNLIISSNTANDGGGICIAACLEDETCDEVLLEDVQVMDNSATNGGGMYIGAGNVVTLDEPVLDANTASAKGGGLYSIDASVTLKDALFTFNTTSSVTTFGGGVYALRSVLTLNGEGCSIKSNRVSSGYGGGMYLESAGLVLDISSLTIEGCAGSFGGGLYLKNTTVGQESEHALESIRFSSNVAGYDGGGLYLDASSWEIRAAELIMEQNTASSSGGVLFAKGGGTCVVEDTDELPGELRDNIASNYHGGALYLSSTACTLRNLVFEGNAATASSGRGGAIYSEISGSVEAEDCLFRESEAASGGAVYGAESGSAYPRLNFTRCTFEGNSAAEGSAIRGGDVHVDHSLFLFNEATGSGGTIWLGGTDPAEIRNSIFYENESSSASSGYGGALLLKGSGLKTISQNTFIYTGFAYTSAAEIYIADATVELKNNLLTGLSTGYGINVYSSSSGASSVTHDFNSDGISDNLAHAYKYPLGGDLATASVYTQDPVFIATSPDEDFCNEDLHLSSAGPYLDMGTTAGDLDTDGSPAQFGAYGNVEGDWDYTAWPSYYLELCP